MALAGWEDRMELVAIIEWLRGIEEQAFHLYERAAVQFESQPELVSFWRRLAQDEMWHCHLMGSAVTLLKKRADAPLSVLKLDKQTRENVEGPLRLALARLDGHDVSLAEMAEGMMEVEFSEMNDIFLYVINTCQSYSKIFQHLASTIQDHEDRIVQFLDNLPEEIRPPRAAQSLPKIWQRRILVVEDEPVIRALWKRILERCCASDVLVAENGQVGLDLLRHTHVDLVISDVEMPVMKGGELYRRAVQEDARLRDRFIFCTGFVTHEINGLVADSGLQLLEKPVAIHELQAAIQKTLERERQEDSISA